MFICDSDGQQSSELEDTCLRFVQTLRWTLNKRDVDWIVLAQKGSSARLLTNEH